MINLASRRKRPKGYVSIFTNVDTYYSKRLRVYTLPFIVKVLTFAP